jgi:hypothetical protein
MNDPCVLSPSLLWSIDDPDAAAILPPRWIFPSGRLRELKALLAWKKLA